MNRNALLAYASNRELPDSFSPFDLYPNIHYQFLNDNARAPFRTTEGSVGYDIHCSHSAKILARSRQILGTGIAIAIPQGHYGRIASKSSLSCQHGLEAGAGVIDCDFRGEIKVLLYNHSDKMVRIKKDTAIAQLIFECISLPLFYPESIQLEDTLGGTKGLQGDFTIGPFNQ